MKIKGSLYLIPAPITTGETDPLTESTRIRDLFCSITHFIVEDFRTARRYMRKAGYSGDFNEITFFPMGKHADMEEFHTYLQPCLEGVDVGLLSEAGMPCIADPGARFVSMAHAFGIRVHALPGPSSILLGLAASGLNGQAFEFHGYLSIDEKERRNQLLAISRDVISTGKTHIFIEAPFRNDKLLKAILAHCPPDVGLCIASSISEPAEHILTLSVKEWKTRKASLGKQPVVFLLGLPS